MTTEQLLAWVQSHNYPQLVLPGGDIVKPGQLAWNRLLSDTSGRIEQALDRISAFLERLEREHTKD